MRMSRGTGIDKRRHRRHLRRIPCKLVVGEREYTAIVLDLSVSGLFIQTHARPRIGERLRLHLTHASVPLELTVQVMRAKHVPPNLTAMAKGGIGTRIVSAPAEYDRLLVELGIGENAEPFELESEAGRRFRVYAAQLGGSRSRRVDVAASDPDEAQLRALEELGSGWKAIRVQAL
jgi:Tfp pilus assembly protein PilZ